MERYIGLFEKKDDKPEVGELIINGNHIEFYWRGTRILSKSVLMSGADCEYRVFINGENPYGSLGTLDNTGSYHVEYALKQGYPFEEDETIKRIESVSFIIPELIKWLGFKTVNWALESTEEIKGFTKKMSNIILKSQSPHIEIYFEQCHPAYSGMDNQETTLLLINQPRIRIVYEKEVDLIKVRSDIKATMQFFALLIGQ